MYLVCSVRITNRLPTSSARLALCSGREKGNQTAGETDAEDVVHVSRGSLRLEVIKRYSDSGTD